MLKFFYLHKCQQQVAEECILSQGQGSPHIETKLQDGSRLTFSWSFSSISFSSDAFPGLSCRIFLLYLLGLLCYFNLAVNEQNEEGLAFFFLFSSIEVNSYLQHCSATLSFIRQGKQRRYLDGAVTQIGSSHTDWEAYYLITRPCYVMRTGLAERGRFTSSYECFPHFYTLCNSIIYALCIYPIYIYI